MTEKAAHTKRNVMLWPQSCPEPIHLPVGSQVMVMLLLVVPPQLVPLKLAVSTLGMPSGQQFVLIAEALLRLEELDELELDELLLELEELLELLLELDELDELLELDDPSGMFTTQKQGVLSSHATQLPTELKLLVMFVALVVTSAMLKSAVAAARSMSGTALTPGPREIKTHSVCARTLALVPTKSASLPNSITLEANCCYEVRYVPEPLFDVFG